MVKPLNMMDQEKKMVSKGCSINFLECDFNLITVFIIEFLFMVEPIHIHSISKTCLLFVHFHDVKLHICYVYWNNLVIIELILMFIYRC